VWRWGRSSLAEIRSSRSFVLCGRCVHSGVARGRALVSSEAFSFSHGIDPATGRVTDPLHDWRGETVRGKVLVFPFGKGSTTGGLWILEMARLGNTPAGIVNLRADPVVVSGFVMAAVIYGVRVPIIDGFNLNPCTLIETGEDILIDAICDTFSYDEGGGMRIPSI